LILGNPLQALLSSNGMRKFWPLLLFVPPMIAVWIWASLSLDAPTVSAQAQLATPQEIRVRRTGVETLAPKEGETEQSAPREVVPSLSTPGLQLPSAGLTRIQGEVVDQDGNPIDAVVFSTHCSSRAYTENGRFELYFFASNPRECDVQASTEHGMLNAISATEWVDIEPEQNTWVRLQLDSQPQGGLGVGFVLNGEGAVITWVHPGGPGMRGGLEAGDVILEVDGFLFEDVYDPNTFIQTTVGPVGSPVSLLVKGEFQIRTFIRGHISEDLDGSLGEDIPAEPTGGPFEATVQDSGWAPVDTGWSTEWDTGWPDTGL
jgi:hypothetical protein